MKSYIIFILILLLFSTCKTEKEEDPAELYSTLRTLEFILKPIAPRPPTVYTLNPLYPKTEEQAISFTKLTYTSDCTNSQYDYISMDRYIAIIQGDMLANEKWVFSSGNSNLEDYLLSLTPLFPLYPFLFKGEPEITINTCQPSFANPEIVKSEASYTGTSKEGTLSFQVSGKYHLRLVTFQPPPSDLRVRKE
ncbi:MAG: hypothetical protein KBF93_20090 [Leptospiraceae bacterium]|nr:hypothetical protein [Leptospiraceae bacterium]